MTTHLSVRLNDGRVLPVNLRHHGRTRRLTARLDPRDDAVRVTAPPRVKAKEIQAFLDEHRDWLADQLAKRGARIALTPGTQLPIDGVPRDITATGQLRGLPVLTATTLDVPGEVEHIARRVTEFCKKRARATILPLAETKAASILTRVKRVSIRDTTSRWGSCTDDGCLSFSWRLILAPPPVLDYVVAHEVAHLRYMDHSDQFWALNAQLTLADMAEQRAWLRRHGHSLFRYG